MKLAALCALTSLVLATAAVQAQSTCDATAAARDTAHLAEIRTALRAVKQADDDIGNDVPPAVQQQLPVLKDILATTVRDVLACTPADVQLPAGKPAAIEAKLAALLHANAPQPPDGSVSKDDPRYEEFLSTEWPVAKRVRCRRSTSSCVRVTAATRWSL
jgi:hypothetical protein